MLRKSMFKASVAGAVLALLPAMTFAQTTPATTILTTETTSPGSTPHYIDTTLAAVLAAEGVATVQITEGATLTNSVQAVAEGRLDIAPAPLILTFLLSHGIGPYSGLGKETGAELAGGLRALFFLASSALVFGHYNNSDITDVRNLEGKRIWNGPPRGAALTSGRAALRLLSGLDDGKGYEGVQTPWPDTVATITGGAVDGWVIPEGLPSGRQITIAAAGGTTLYDIPSEILDSELGRQIVNAPGHAPYSIPVEEYRAAYAGNDITIVTDDDTFDSYALAFAQVVTAEMDEELAYRITRAFLNGQERFEKSSPRGPYLFLSFGDIDGVSQGVCGAVDMRMHPGAIRAYEEAGYSIADCVRP